MIKPTLKINKVNIINQYGTLGLTETLNYLINSNLFNIEYHDVVIPVSKQERAAVLFVNDKKVYLDFWDYSLPTYSKKVYDFNFDLIIKIQHPTKTNDQFLASCKKKSVLSFLEDNQKIEFFNKIVPWSFFCSRMMNPFVDGTMEVEDKPIERIGFFCGKTWKSRWAMEKFLPANGIEFISSDQGLRRGKVMGDKEYLHKMMTSKFGIVIPGRSSHFTEAKNRREIDYMLLKKPLLLNYRPTYYNPLIEGKHYIYFDTKINIKELDQNYDLKSIVENATNWYNDNASPIGIARTFKQIMEEKGIL